MASSSAAAGSDTPRKTVQVFILAGQSNAVGYNHINEYHGDRESVERRLLARRASDRPTRSPVRTSIPLPGSHPRASLRESLNHSASGMKLDLLATDLPIQGP